jgi:flagellin-specific chaperone FliS
MAKKTVVEEINKANRFTINEDVQLTPENAAQQETALDLAVAMMRGYIPTDRELSPVVELPPDEMKAVSEAAAAMVEALIGEIKQADEALASTKRADNAVEVIKLNQCLAELRARLYEARRTEITADMDMLDYMFAQWQTVIQSAKDDAAAARDAAKAAVIAERAMQRRVEIIGNHMSNNRDTHATFAQQRDELRRIYQATQVH